MSWSAPTLFYGKWELTNQQQNILDLDFDRWIDDLMKTEWIWRLFNAAHTDWKLSSDSLVEFGNIIDEIKNIIQDKFPEVTQITDHIVWAQYLNKAQQIHKKLEEIKSNDAYEQREAERNSRIVCIDFWWLDAIIYRFVWYQNTISEHIANLKKQEDAQKKIIEESKKYGWTIAANLD